jgi:hypothetical protein
MGWFREQLRAELRAALRPELGIMQTELQRSLGHAINDVGREVRRVRELEAREISSQRLELEQHARIVMDALNEAHTRFATERATQHSQMRILLEDLEHLVERVTNQRCLPGSAVDAGSTAEPMIGGANEHEIDLTDSLVPGTRVEARSRFSDAWFGGYEVGDVVQAADGKRRFRLLRERDRQAVPLIFGRDDIRIANDAERPTPNVASV